MKKFLSTMRGNSRRNSNRKTFYIGGAIFAVGLLALFFTPLLVGYLAAFVMMPVSSLQNWFAESSSSIPAYFRDRNTLVEENRSLEDELAKLKNSEVVSEVLERESNILSSLANDNTKDQIIAGLVSRPGVLPYDVFLIDKGSSDGVSLGAPVYAGAWQAVGFISKVYSDMSLVILATSPGYESVVYIYGPDIYTTAIGQGGGILEVNVPQGIAISEGDPVVIPALNAGLYGAISYIESVPSEPQQRGYVSMETPLNSIRFVSVGTNPLIELSFDEAREVVQKVRQDMLSVPVPEGILVETEMASSSNDLSTTTEEISDEDI